MDDSTRVGLAGAPAPLKFPIGALLKRYGLRATRQRRGLARLLFGRGDRHLTAEALAAEARAANTPTSLATVYNVLNLLSEVGLVRSLPIEGDRTIFDTNTTDHSHYFFEDTKEVADIGPREMKYAEQIEAPEGYEISRIDCVVRLRKRATGSPAPDVVDAVRPCSRAIGSPKTFNPDSA
jgi:Fur family iron response transcriptional regulator